MATPTRAQDNGVSTKRLRSKAFTRLERMRCATLAMKQEWSALDDTTTDEMFDRFTQAVNGFESELAGVLAYHDLPVGQEPES